MLALTDRDLDVFVVLAEQASGPGDGASETLAILKAGFSEFGSEDVIPTYPSRQKYFESLSPRLLKNYAYAGRDFAYFTDVLEGRGMIFRIVSSSGVPQAEVEDVVQEILQKLWKGHWIERYNPLTSSWVHFIYRPVKNYIATYFEKSRRKKRYCPNLVHVDFDHVYNTSLEDSPENFYLIQEFLGRWEDFLQTQPALVRGDQADLDGPPFRRLCTLLPPGSAEIPTESELTLYFLRKGTHVARVALPELYSSGVSSLVESGSLVDYISMDEDTRESLRDLTGNWVTQKYYINPLFLNYRKRLFRTFDYLDFYHSLRDGLAMEEIAGQIHLSVKSVPYWVHKLERLFRSFWLVTDLVPLGLKYLATESYRCPVCARLSYQPGAPCTGCGLDLEGVSRKPGFVLYPWPRLSGRGEVRRGRRLPVDFREIRHHAM